MAAISIPKSAKARLVLTAGTDPATGKAVTRNVFLSGLAADPDATKIFDVVDAAAAVLEHPVSRVEVTEVSTLEKTA